MPEPLRRYFRPGTNWAGRTIYGIPVFGLVLIAMSQGAYALGQGWVIGGLAIFAALAYVGEGVLWPAEQRLQVALSRAATEVGRGTTAGRTRTGARPRSGACITTPPFCRKLR